MEALAGMSFADAAVRAYDVFELRQFGQARDDQIARGNLASMHPGQLRREGGVPDREGDASTTAVDAEVVKSDV